MKRSTYIMGTMIMAGVALMASVFVYVRSVGVEYTPIKGVRLTSETVRYDLPEFDSVKFDLRYEYNEEAMGAVYCNDQFPITLICNDSAVKPYMCVPKELVESKSFDMDSTALSITINSTSPYLQNVPESGGVKIVIPSRMKVNNIEISDHCWASDLKIVYMNGDNMTVKCSSNKDQNLNIEQCSWNNFSSLNFSRIAFNDFESDEVTVWACRETRVIAEDAVDVKSLVLTGGTVDFILDGFKDYEVKPIGDATIGVKQLYK